MIWMTSSDAFDGITFATFSAKNVPVVIAVMISPFLMELLMFSFPNKTTHSCIKFFNNHIVESKACCVVSVGLKAFVVP